MRSLILAALLMPTPALAHDFNCRNEQAEIRCDSGSCEVESASFTPMGLTRRGGMLSICAYSGCSEGPILMHRTRGGIELLYAEVRLTQPGNRKRESIAVIYDRAQNTAQMRWGGFSNVMTCS